MASSSNPRSVRISAPSRLSTGAGDDREAGAVERVGQSYQANGRPSGGGRVDEDVVVGQLRVGGELVGL